MADVRRRQSEFQQGVRLDGGEGTALEDFWSVEFDDRERSGEELYRQIEVRFAAMLAHSLDGVAIYRLDEDSGEPCLYLCNDAFAHMAGRSREELRELDNLDAMVVLEKPAAQKQARGYARGQGFRIEGAWHRPDGKENYFERTALPFSLGGESFFLVVDRDITWRKQDERALRETQQQLRFQAMLLDQIADYVTATDLDGTITYVNHAVTEFFGLPREQMLGRHVRMYEDINDSSGVRQDDILRQTRREGQWEGEITYRAPDGREKLIHLRTWLVHDSTDKPQGICGAGVDITERQRAVRQLRDSEERFRLLAENSNDLICLHDLDGTYRYVSPACRALQGYRPEELLGRNPYEFFHPDDRQRIRTESHDRTLRGERVQRLCYRIRRKDDRYIWFETDTVPLEDENGQIVRLLSTSRDVTDRKCIEDALQRRVRELNILLRIDELFEQHMHDETAFFKAVAEAVSKLWHDDAVSGCRIEFAERSYQAGSVQPHEEAMQEDLVVEGQALGMIHLFCPEGVGQETGEYRQEDFRLLHAVADRLSASAEHIRMEAALKAERRALQESNIAMRQIMRNIEIEKSEVADSTQANLDKIALPQLRELRAELSRPQQRKLDILIEKLQNVTDPFAGRFQRAYEELTPTELRICELIRNGHPSKAIASVLHISTNTVNRHRENIRNKLGLTNTGENLTRFLQRYGES